MEALGKSAAGRRLYYEFAVDEDDHDGYFSSALLRFYTPTQEEKAKLFYRESYLYAKEFYRSAGLSSPPPLMQIF
jgi:hypothetical protein